MDNMHLATWDGKRKSSGFHMVAHLSTPHRKMKPLYKGSTPQVISCLQNLTVSIKF